MSSLTSSGQACVKVKKANPALNAMLVLRLIALVIIIILLSENLSSLIRSRR